ncbi:MAG: S1C family serine protease [Patescibacteria group bacterium]
MDNINSQLETKNKFFSKINKKSLGGILWLILFLGLIVYAKSYYSGSNVASQLNAIKFSLTSLFNKDKSAVTSFVTQEVVEEESSVIDVVDKVSPSVVSIVIKTVTYDFFDPFSRPTSSEGGIGTGFIVGENGIIITNSHVVDSTGEYSVVLNDGTTYEVEAVHLDAPTDLAILEVSARGLPAVDLGDSDSIKVGQKAIAIGNALGRFSNTVTTGVVSGIARELIASGGLGSMTTYEGAVQTDAALNPGNSGGPLLNSSGQVIGINVATTFGADNIGFAIPVNVLKPILEGYTQHGRIIRPFLGVSYSMITKDIAALRNYPEGAFVSRVIPNTPAADAGLQRGDIIVKMDETFINEENPLNKVISQKSVGDKITVIVDRLGEEETFEVTLEEAPNNAL